MKDINREKYSLLLAEDNPASLKVAAGMLEKLGFNAEAVFNGKEALKELEKKPYDLVLMDIEMPEMDGIEAVCRLRSGRAGELNREVPVIAMTAHAMDGDREKCLKAGMNDYIAKPVAYESLSKVIEKWLDRGTEVKSTAETVENSSGSSVGACGSVFDRSGFLQRLLGDRELALKVAEEFFKDLSPQLDELEHHWNKSALDALKRKAHAIKGSSANIGGERLKKKAEELEAAVSRGRDEIIEQLISEIRFEFNALWKAVEKDL